MERTFKKKIFEPNSGKKLPHVSDLKNFKVFFEKTYLFFQKKPKILNVLRILVLPVAFYGKFAESWWKINFRFRREHTADVGENAIENHRVKKTHPF